MCSVPSLASSSWMFRLGIAPSEDVELKNMVKHAELQSQNLVLLPLIKAVEGRGLIHNFQSKNLYLIQDGLQQTQIWS